MPVITASHSASIIQTLLHNGPLPIRRYDKTVQVNLKSVGDRIVVYACGKSTGADRGFAIEAAALSNQAQLGGCVSRELSATAANVDAEFTGAGSEATFGRSHCRRG